MINIRNIKNLTKIFVKSESIYKLLYDEKKKKISKKSLFFWCSIIAFIGIGYLSYEVLDFLFKIHQPTLFLSVFFLLLLFIIMFQISLTCTNVFYFSKDIELILPLPIKPLELLTSKFFTVLINSYYLELIVGIIPLLMYGIFAHSFFSYYLWVIIVLIIFPIFPALIVSTFMLVIIKITKFIKKKDFLQIIIVMIFSFIISNFFIFLLNEIFTTTSNVDNIDSQEYYSERIMGVIDSIDETVEKLLVVKPSIKLLITENGIEKVYNLFKLLIFNSLVFIIFSIIGKITYLKDILNNIIYNLSKEKVEINLKGRCKKRRCWYRYIDKEIKQLLRNPIYFIQSVFPSLILMVLITAIVIKIAPGIREFIEQEITKMQLGDIEIDIGVIATILSVIQIVFTFSNNISITAISREGRNLYVLKALPISFFKQLVYKSIPQILLNSMIIIITMFLIQYIDESFPFIYLMFIGIIALIMSISNSFLMILVDLKRPNLTWDSEYDVIKQNNNKIFQYFWSVITVVIIFNVGKVVEDYDLLIASSLLLGVLLFIMIGIIFIIKKKCDKLINSL